MTTMLQDLVDCQQIRLCEDRSSSFRGTISVDLDRLTFVQPPGDGLPENVRKLLEIFCTKGCYPFEPENRIAAIIEPKNLQSTLQASGLSQHALLENPGGMPPMLNLPFEYPLRCLKGRSRVEAAKVHLPPGKRVWAVDLYLEGVAGHSLLSRRY